MLTSPLVERILQKIFGKVAGAGFKPAPTSWRGFKGLGERLKHAFALGDKEGLTQEELALLERLAKAVIHRRMATPAILFLESLIPLSYIGSQVMHFLRPFMTFLFSQEEYDRLSHLLEKRSTLEHLIETIKRLEKE